MIKSPYVDRDLSWLDFNYRVLQEAKDPSVPLLERIKFMAIYSSNLDEFFRVRVANHRNMMRVGKKTRKNLDYNPANILEAILNKVNEQQEEFSRLFDEELVPELHNIGISIVRRHELTPDQEVFIDSYFDDYMLPYVQPVLLFGKKVKPFLNNSALYLALHLEDIQTKQFQYALVKIPSDHLPRFVELPSRKEGVKEIILLDDLVRHKVSLIFPGFAILDSYSIKLTRDAELYIDNEYSGDLIDKIKKSLTKRNIGPASRLVYDRNISSELLNYLMDVFELTSYDLLPEGRYHNNSDFFSFPSFGLKHHKDPVLEPISIPILESAPNIFETIKKKDYLVHVPYHSYESVIKFFEDAAIDVSVTHIKIIQYRVAKVSRIMGALKKAVQNGKQVTAFIEIKARFDEEANLKWGEELEEAGVTVHYSMPGFKVHSKLAIIRRIENGIPNIYAYLSTGNFHEGTAKIYSDIGIFTANPLITSESTRIFSYLETKKKPENEFKHLGVGLFNLKDKFKALINREITNARAGKEASMTLKMNSLQDREMIEYILKAGEAGVHVNLIIRGICCIIPGAKEVSENIKAISIVDRYLEHARIFHFHNNGKDDIYFSSADWMVRNLHYRVETLVPILDEGIKATVKVLLRIQLNDNVKARSIHSIHNNEYIKVGSNTDLAVRSQVETYFYIKRITELMNKPNKT
jgi:polyphosphate kinase